MGEKNKNVAPGEKIFHLIGRDMENHLYICSMKRSCVLILCAVLWSMMTACYTATESTPRIKAEKEELRTPTPEEMVMEYNFVEKGCHTWQEGKTFISIEDALSPMLRPVAGGAIKYESGLMGKQFVYRGYMEENLYGNKEVIYLVYECEGNSFLYNTGKSLTEIQDLNYTPLIPSLIDMDNVAMARSLFVGKQLYILTEYWYNAIGDVIEGRHLIPVEITAVEPGTSVLPLAIHFVDDRGVEAQVYISTKSSSSTQLLSFDRLFSYENPRLKYQHITDAVWNAITEGRLIKGMTKQECRLSVGLPSEINKIPTYSGVKEQWMYNNGAYLFFSDGMLEEFRQP